MIEMKQELRQELNLEPQIIIPKLFDRGPKTGNSNKKKYFAPKNDRVGYNWKFDGKLMYNSIGDWEECKVKISKCEKYSIIEPKRGYTAFRIVKTKYFDPRKDDHVIDLSTIEHERLVHSRKNDQVVKEM